MEKEIHIPSAWFVKEKIDSIDTVAIKRDREHVVEELNKAMEDTEHPQYKITINYSLNPVVLSELKQKGYEISKSFDSASGGGTIVTIDFSKAVAPSQVARNNPEQ